MEDIKLTVTQEEREETIDKILNLIEIEFQGTEVTALFTRKILEDTIKTLENRCMETPLRILNYGNGGNNSKLRRNSHGKKFRKSSSI